MKIKLITRKKQMLSDTLTPVSIYLQLRDKYSNSILLESSDYNSQENSFSYICCDPIATFKVEKGFISIASGGKSTTEEVRNNVIQKLQEFKDSFDVSSEETKFIQNGLFGYISYNGVENFEEIQLKNNETLIPEVLYSVYRFVIAVDHFSNQLYVFEHSPEGETSKLEEFVSLIKFGSFPNYQFKVTDKEKSNLTDDEFMDIVRKCIKHCDRGDVFQIVPSRRFENSFKGDEFNVYRALRSVNPSPYLFYFDFGSFKIFGSSPETQILIRKGEASIHPIAGTFKRTGNDEADRQLAHDLKMDKKENAEHVMLVDLARNDLSINSNDVKVDVFKEVQYYSHVIHLVSKVSGKLKENVSPLQLVADTFPAGTLSGAPKHMAMKLIDSMENIARDSYGGAIGFMGFNGDFNHAIIIRSFLSIKQRLLYQAGAGVVSKSDPEKELNEVKNKLQALRSALIVAEEID